MKTNRAPHAEAEHNLADFLFIRLRILCCEIPVRDGTRNREAGTLDALLAARALASGPASGLVIDTAQRPQPRAKALADSLRGIYIALPKADAQTLNRAIRATHS